MKKICGVLGLSLGLMLILNAYRPSQDQAVTTPIEVVNSPIESGVALSLAQSRAARISDIIYDLDFTIPPNKTADIDAKETLRFNLTQSQHDLLLDFREDANKIKTIHINGVSTEPVHENEHLIIPAKLLKSGPNIIDIDFIAGNSSLNRNPDYLYTLFVPDRARTVFPVFDQPNLKAHYNLKLTTPSNWTALSNAPVANITKKDGQAHYQFETSDLMSSYLFSFVAGEFKTVTRKMDGRSMTLLHRETDPDKINRNINDIFQAHSDALAWLEDYTNIPYPFKKFDFVAIPGFQYGGMEHVGAIQYRASTLFLPANPDDTQRLNRANLIAHETAHMWFGDLVTMDWFNDVWTKEVFANFMAAKAVNPSFPKIDHNLNFLLRSYPSAYAIDRTQGANPIRQDLPNLNEAGNLYGNIIYNKAPIMMQQLELLLGEDIFREGIREYLTRFANKNATWPDLIHILDKRSKYDLKMWSHVWVSTAGRPHFTFEPRPNSNGMILKQSDPKNQNRFWAQRFDVSFTDSPDQTHPIDLTTQNNTHELDVGAENILTNITGTGYGVFPVNFTATIEVWDSLNDLQKGAQIINLYEQMLEGHPNVTPQAYLEFLITTLGEPNELLLNQILDQMRQIFGSYIAVKTRIDLYPNYEIKLWDFIDDTTLPVSTRKIYLRSLQNIATTPQTLTRLKAIWSGQEQLSSIVFSQREKSNMAALLAMKLPKQSDAIITQHLETLQNPDERRRFEFIAPTLSPNKSVRDEFFLSLKHAENRANENWTTVALGYLHHPSRTDQSQEYIKPSLELLEEIQRTGDIFFPSRWITQTLRNHTSASAAQDVTDFLTARPDYNPQLKMKILQAADPLFRARELNP